MKVSLSRFRVFWFSRFLCFLLVIILFITQAHAQVISIPDPSLREAIRKTLQLPAGSSITQQDMEKLEYLDNEKTEKMGITDLTGLEYAINLSSIALNQNEITDLSPLSNLIQLKSLGAWGNPISNISPLAKLTNLRFIDLGGCDIADITPLSNLTKLKTLQLGWNHLIQDISPLANLTNLQSLRLNHNRIVDLSPLSNLIQLESLGAWANPISDISSLAKLTNLRHIDLNACHIVDITPLANLTKLYHLKLSRNRIVDISPLANLTQLKELFIDRNRIIDFSPIEGLSLTRFVYDEPCELPAFPIEQRIKNRTFPSVFAAWGGFGGTKVLNRSDLPAIEQLALHDCYWDNEPLRLDFALTKQGWSRAGDPEEAQSLRDNYLALNPNMLFLVDIRATTISVNNDLYPEDFPYWLRDENGNPILTSSGNAIYIDFTQPGMQDIIVEQAIAVAKCGLFDGIMLDGFHEWGALLEGYYSLEEEQDAKDTILQRIRAAVRDDFLIIANYNRGKMHRRAWGINGSFMEIVGNRDTEYTRQDVKQIENTLLWLEQNLRPPRINCLEGWGIPTEPPDSPNNRRWMRLFTTMSLTLSDGYVLYNDGNVDHEHFWYSFWDADLGRPIGPKVQPYQNIEGIYIREFTNGWAVYNRSGKTQAITLPRVSTGISSNKQDTTHLLPDLDGEIYLRKGKPFDLNRDGTINILDLILVSQHFGTTEGDINGDGTTNIVDLTLVAQQFSK